MDFFEEIADLKQDMPKVQTVEKNVKKLKFNFYQIFAIGIFVVSFFLGILFGNLFATCGATSYVYTNVCVVREFNFSLMIFIWFISLLVSIFFYSIGHIIALLTSINKKLSKLLSFFSYKESFIPY